MSKSLEGKRVLITGGTRGIGASISIRMAEQGAEIICLYREKQEQAEKHISCLSGENHLCVKCDITDPDQLAKTFGQLQESKQALDLVVNNAGIGYHHEIDQVDFQSWQDAWSHILNTNLIGPSNLCYQAAQLMIKQGFGRIINVSSRGAYRGEPQQPAYGASKAGLNSMTQSLAFALAPYGIFVGAIAPGFVETEMSRDRILGETGIKIKAQSPMNRVAQPHEIAEAVCLMASSNLWMTGAIWDVNGASYFR